MYKMHAFLNFVRSKVFESILQHCVYLCNWIIVFMSKSFYLNVYQSNLKIQVRPCPEISWVGGWGWGGEKGAIVSVFVLKLNLTVHFCWFDYPFCNVYILKLLLYCSCCSKRIIIHVLECVWKLYRYWGKDLRQIKTMLIAVFYCGTVSKIVTKLFWVLLDICINCIPFIYLCSFRWYTSVD